MKQLNEKLFKSTKLIKILKQKANILDMIIKQFPHVSNGMPTDYVTLNNTAKSPMEVSLTPQQSQETTSGAQVYDINNDDISVNPDFVIDSDGWISLAFNNTGESTVFYNFYKTIPKIKNSTNYNVIVEIANVSGTGDFYVVSTGGSSVFTNGYTLSLNNISSNTIYNEIRTTKSDAETSGGLGMRTFVRARTGESGSIKFRLSLLEDTTITPSTFVYQKYTGALPSPSPDYPQEIHCTTGEQKIKIVNANLFNKNTISDGYIDADGRILVSVNYKTSDFIEIDSSIRYAKTKTNSPRVKLFDKNKQLITTESFSDIANFSNAGTFSIPYENAKYIRFTTRIDQPDSTVDKVMFATEGTLPSSYEENEETTYPISLGTKEMFNINNVSDGFVYDEATDKFYINRKIGKVVLNGSESWTYSTSNEVYVLKLGPVFPQRTTIVPFSNYFIGQTTSTFGQVLDKHISLQSTATIDSQRFLLKFLDVGSSVNDLQQWLSTHNTIVVYQLATSTLEEITDSILISQLRAIKNALSMQETTHIISTATGENLPFLIKASALKSFE